MDIMVSISVNGGNLRSSEMAALEYNLEVNLVNRDHINRLTAIYSCLTMLIFFINEVSFACGFIGNNIKRSQHVTKCNVLCMFLCVCACVHVCVCVCVCVRACMHAC